MGNSSTDRGKEILEFITSPEYKEKPIYLPKYDIYFVPQDEAEEEDEEYDGDECDEKRR